MNVQRTLNVRDTFLLLVPSSHLWIVIYSVGYVVAIVNVTTRLPDFDESCIVRPGEHPFVTRDSIVAYRKAQVTESQAAKESLANNLRNLEPVSEALLERIRAGALASPYTPEKIKTLLRAV